MLDDQGVSFVEQSFYYIFAIKENIIQTIITQNKETIYTYSSNLPHLAPVISDQKYEHC